MQYQIATIRSISGYLVKWLSLQQNFIQQSFNLGSAQVQPCTRRVGGLQC